MKNILVPTDFSTTADHAARLALEVAQSTNATLYLLHTMEYNYVGPLGMDGTFVAHDTEKPAIDRMLKEGDQKLSEYIENLHVHDPHVKKKLGLGKPDDVIVQNIDELDIDLVVMGSHGSSGLAEFFIGSNAEKVIRKAKCPVITVKQATKMADIKKIVFASDLIETNDHIVAQIKQLQDMFKADLSIVRVNTPLNFERDAVVKSFKEKLKEKFVFNDVDIETYNDHTLEEGLRHYADENNVDMIALATHGRKGIGHVVAGSIAEDLMNHTAKAVWTSHF